MCCTNRGLGPGDTATSLCVFPPPPPPPWWQELDYSYFMWSGVGLGICLLINFCRRTFKETAEFVAPANDDFDAVGGRFFACARCDNRLAVNMFVMPDGEERPLCHQCFQTKSRDYSLAMGLLDGRQISAQLGIVVAPAKQKGGAGGNSAVGDAYLATDATNHDDGAVRAGGSSTNIGAGGSSARTTTSSSSSSSRRKSKQTRHAQVQGQDRSSGGKVNIKGKGKVKGTDALRKRGSDGSVTGGRRAPKHEQREAWTPPDE